jgi:tRNA-2-methylthio-N6-dimethylallyladenosine synthase
MKVYLETMGCQMNLLDSELAAGLLRSAGHEMVADRRSADVILYNTCTVRQHAEDKVFSRVGADGQRKEAGKKLIVGVLGCVAQGKGDRIRKWYPQVDIVCGPGQIHRLPELIEQAAGGKPAVALDEGRTGPRHQVPADAVAAAAGLEEAEVHRDATLSPGRSQAFVRVARGCDKFCTYCVVPFVRGPEQSRPPDAVVEEVRRLMDAGRTQVTLLGQTVNSYRWSGGGESVRFSDLLARVSAVPGLRRLRFVTSHPLNFGDDILQAMRDLPNLCPYIHCPAQSGSDAVLARMKRGYTRAQYDDLMDRARATVPGVVLSGDFIVGFPGETEEDHAASADLIRRSDYKNSFIFKYSPREGTLAARKFPDDVPDIVKKRRNKELLAVQKEVAYAHHKQFVGQTLEVLVEGPSPLAVRGRQKSGEDRDSTTGSRVCCPDSSGLHTGILSQLVGRTRGDHIVVFDGPPELADQYVSIEITEAAALTLTGRRKN